MNFLSPSSTHATLPTPHVTPISSACPHEKFTLYSFFYANKNCHVIYPDVQQIYYIQCRYCNLLPHCFAGLKYGPYCLIPKMQDLILKYGFSNKKQPITRSIRQVSLTLIIMNSRDRLHVNAEQIRKKCNVHSEIDSNDKTSKTVDSMTAKTQNRGCKVK